MPFTKHCRFHLKYGKIGPILGTESCKIEKNFAKHLMIQ